MPHMANLPWMETYFMISLLVMVMTSQNFFHMLQPLTKKLANSLKSENKWKW